jgi:PAS domain S-box-containing protein
MPDTSFKETLHRLLLERVCEDAVFALDGEGRIAAWGGGAERITGYPEEEVLGRSLALLYPDGGAPEEVLRRAGEHGRFEVEEEWVRRDGVRLRVAAAFSELREGGRRVGYGVVARDLTDRLRSEHVLQQRAALVKLLQLAAVAANEAESVEDALQTTLDEVCAYTGWPVGHAYLPAASGELVSSGIWHLDDPERFRAFREQSERIRFAPGTGLPGEVAAAGQPVWVEELEGDPHFIRGRTAATLVRAAFAFPVLIGREVAGVLEFFRDEPAAPDPALLEAMTHIGVQLGRVVERSRAREELRRSEAKFAGIISISSDAIVSVDADQRITLFNRGAEQVFGYSAEEVLGESLDLLIPERFRPGHRAQVEGFGESPVVSRRMGERGRISGRRKSGEVFPADASISKLDVGGRRIYTAVLRDVTERVRAEEELAARTTELERSNHELEQFAYVASHDLQEPLRMVASYTQLLARRYREKLDADAEEFIGYAVDGVTRMQALINDLLAYSRVGTRGGGFEPVDLDALLGRVLSSLGPAMEEAGATVTHDPLPVVVGDPGQLGQLLQNLVANAVKFRGDEPPRVHVSAERGDGHWTFTVRDNGIGIDPEYADRIFVIFQRLHTRNEYPGTGIGLAICKKIVERHGGRIWFDSVPGEGTTFRFTIPDRESDDP